MSITVVGEFAVYAGYASMNEYLVLGMHRAGADFPLRRPNALSIDGWPALFAGAGMALFSAIAYFVLIRGPIVHRLPAPFVAMAPGFSAV